MFISLENNDKIKKIRNQAKAETKQNQKKEGRVSFVYNALPLAKNSPVIFFNLITFNLGGVISVFISSR